MSDYYNILTNLGRSKITDLITSDTALENIQIAFGDGNGSVPTPNPARTALVNEVHRRPANKLQKHPTLTNSIIVDVVIPNNVGGFWIREFGIYFDGVLICNGSLPPSYKEASEDSVNTYRLKPYINVESDRLNVVEVEGNLVNATESWTEENFIKRSEIIDNLTTNDSNKVASARTVKELQDNKLDKTDLKDASTVEKGVLQLATLTEVLAGINDNKAVTAKALAGLYGSSFSEKFGRIIIPSGNEIPWILQWGISENLGDISSGRLHYNGLFPVAFPNNVFLVMPSIAYKGNPTNDNVLLYWDMALTTKTNFDIQYLETSAAVQTNQFITWCALGN